MEKAQVFCINLKRRADRRKTALKMLKKLPWPFEIFCAIDGKKINPSFMKRKKFRTYTHWKIVDSKFPFYSRDIKTGEIGCALSHFLVWNEIVKRNLDYGIILEDDARRDKGFRNRFRSSFDQLRKYDPEWDLIYLTRNRGSKLPERRAVKGVVVAEFSYLCTAYILSRAGAKKLIATDFSRKIFAADEFLPAMYCRHPRRDIRTLLKKYPKLKAYAFDPNIMIQSRSDSDTEKSEFFGGRLKNTSLLKTTEDVTIRWANGNFRIITSSGKGFEIDSRGTDQGANVLFLLNNFAKPNSLLKILGVTRRQGDGPALLEYANQLLLVGALQVLRW